VYAVAPEASIRGHPSWIVDATLKESRSGPLRETAATIRMLTPASRSTDDNIDPESGVAAVAAIGSHSAPSMPTPLARHIGQAALQSPLTNVEHDFPFAHSEQSLI
jgi:hypothetical protein